MVAARLGTFSINPIHYNLIWNIVVVAVCACIVCGLAVVNWMEYNELRAVAPWGDDEEAAAAAAPKKGAEADARPMAWAEESMRFSMSGYCSRV